MGLDYEILENEYNKIASDKAEVEARTDLSDEERANALASFDKALEGIESGIVALGTKAKEEIQSAIKDLEAKIAANDEYVKAAEEEMAKRQAEIEEEMAKENPDHGVIEAKQAEIKALEKRIKSLKSATRKIKKEVKEQNKKLIPLMYRFKDKIFTEQEIAELEKLDKKIQRGKALAEKRAKAKEEQPAEEQPVEEQPVEEQPVEEQPVEEQSAENAKGGSGAFTYVMPEEVEEAEIKEEPADNSKDLRTEFNELYLKAKKGTLNQEDYTRLGEIVSEPANFDELGITTGILNNKAKVVLRAMGKFATTNVYKTVADARDFYDIHALEVSDEIISTERAASWGGIKEMAKSSEMKLASQEVFERVIAKAEEIGIDNLTDEQKEAYEKASKHLKNMEDYRKCIDAYSEVREQRRPKIFGWLAKNKAPIALAEAESEVIEETKETVEEEKEQEFKEEEFYWEYTEGEYTEPSNTFASQLSKQTMDIDPYELADEVGFDDLQDTKGATVPKKEEGPEI